MHRRSLFRPAGAVTALVVGLGGTLAAAAPAAASASVQQFRYDNESTFASTDTYSADGCDVVSRSAGTNKTDGATIYYASAHFNKCTGQTFYSLWGQGPTQVYDFARTSVHAVATVPLSDGTNIHLDLTWQGRGPVERTVSTSVHVLPGVSVDRVAIHSTNQEATVTGTQTFEKATISTSKGTGTHVTVGQP